MDSSLSQLKSVLVVEDDFLIAADIEQIFTNMGCADVEVASSCVDAISRVEQHPYDLVTVDVDLRDGSCARLVAGLGELNIPFVYVSGFQQSDHPDLPLAPWLLKPMPVDEMVEVVRTLVR